MAMLPKAEKTVTGTVHEILGSADQQFSRSIPQDKRVLGFHFENVFTDDATGDAIALEASRYVKRDFGDIKDDVFAVDGINVTVAQLVALIEAAGVTYRGQDIVKEQQPPLPPAERGVQQPPTERVQS